MQPDKIAKLFGFKDFFMFKNLFLDKNFESENSKSFWVNKFLGVLFRFYFESKTFLSPTFLGFQFFSFFWFQVFWGSEYSQIQKMAKIANVLGFSYIRIFFISHLPLKSVQKQTSIRIFNMFIHYAGLTQCRGLWPLRPQSPNPSSFKEATTYYQLGNCYHRTH